MHGYELTRIIQQSILEGGKPAKAISEEIGKPYSTMLREANPFDTTAKVGVETLMEIMKATGNLSPLRYMAAKFGFDLVRKSETASEDMYTGNDLGISANA
ncbi:MAG: phage regulatory CII family protein [Desulfovibrionaceae bacterium]